MGRMGGARGHGTTPGIFQLLWHHPLAKYLGTLGIVLPVAVGFYYVYVQSWTLAYRPCDRVHVISANMASSHPTAWS
jgi:neurotransmitter:Na+ symporter, NSS family